MEEINSFQEKINGGQGEEGQGDEGQGDEGQGDEGQGDEGQGDGGQGDEGQGDEGQGDGIVPDGKCHPKCNDDQMCVTGKCVNKKKSLLKRWQFWVILVSIIIVLSFAIYLALRKRRKN